MAQNLTPFLLCIDAQSLIYLVDLLAAAPSGNGIGCVYCKIRNSPQSTHYCFESATGLFSPAIIYTFSYKY